MKLFLMSLVLMSSSFAFAGHGAKYCGTLVEGRWGQDEVFSEHPEVILVVTVQLVDSNQSFKAYAAIVGLDDAQKELVRNSNAETEFCVKAHWEGSLYSSKNLKSISLTTDSVQRFDYQSRF